MRFQSLMPALGTALPTFAAADPAGRQYSTADFAGGQGVLVAFICNHCPFVMHIADRFVEVANAAVARGVRVVAVSSNDVDAYPEDGPEPMARFAAERGFGFPYLYDADQQLALAFGAVCTPDFFLYDGEGRLYYCGQFDRTRPTTPHTVGKVGAGHAATGDDLNAAIEALLAGAPPPAEQWPSQGCSMKWKPGLEPEWG